MLEIIFYFTERRFRLLQGGDDIEDKELLDGIVAIALFIYIFRL